MLEVSKRAESKIEVRRSHFFSEMAGQKILKLSENMNLAPGHEYYGRVPSSFGG